MLLSPFLNPDGLRRRWETVPPIIDGDMNLRAGTGRSNRKKGKLQKKAKMVYNRNVIL